MAWAPDYVTAVELAQYMRIPDTADDIEIAFAISSSSRVIDHHCNRQFGSTDSTEERTFEAKWNGRHSRYIAKIDDLMTQVGLVVTVSGAATTDFELRPFNAAAYGRPWSRLHSAGATPATSGSGPYTVAVEATWGWSAVPETIKQATLKQAYAFFMGKNAPYGIAGSPDVGFETRVLPKIDPHVALMVMPYRRDWPRI